MATVEAGETMHATAEPQTSESGVTFDRDDGICTLMLNRPERKNALTPAGWSAILQHLRDVDPTVDRVLVVRGAGGDFCAGADLSSVPDPTRHAFERIRAVGDVAATLHRLPIPTIAAVRGVAVGAGMNLALCCDLVISTGDARWAQIFAQRGLSPDCGGSWLLPRLIGLARAKELALLGDVFDGRRAHALGLVHRVVDGPEFDDAVSSLAQRLGSGATLALGQTKQLLNNAFDLSLEQACDAEGKALGVNLASADTQEAKAAFLEKRVPRFRGR
jgi:2-(1,2-epoxy-1,2-dihydrophenyl)acetyl-CoA isomerase